MMSVSNVTILRAPRLRNQGSILDTGLLQSIQDGAEAHPASYSLIPAETKQLGHAADHYTSSPHMPSRNGIN